jgi:ABC-type polysaccharide/polyol phosphate export permease
LIFAAAFRDLWASLRAPELWLHHGWMGVARRYRRSVLGPLWHTITLGVFVFVTGLIWSAVMRIDFAGYVAYLTPSLIVWTLLTALVTEGSGIFISAQGLILSLRFPYPVLALSLVWGALIVFAHHLLLFVVVVAIYGPSPSWVMLMAIPGLILVAFNGVWIGLLAGMLCLRFRDLQVVLATVMQLAFFVTPVLWPVELLAPNLAFLVEYNPLFHMLEVVRSPMQGKFPTPANWLGVGLTAAIGWLLTLALYGRMRERLAYWY